MGIYVVTTSVEAEINDKLATRINDVAGEENVTLDDRFDVFRRARAETVYNQGSETASVGIWIRNCRTEAVSQTTRDWEAQTVIDYTYRAQDRDECADQVELTTTAIMRVVDDIVENQDTMITAAETEGETIAVHDIDQMIQAAADLGTGSPYIAATRVEVPMTQREVIGS